MGNPHATAMASVIPKASVMPNTLRLASKAAGTSAAQQARQGGEELAGGVVGVHHVIAAAAHEPCQPPGIHGVVYAGTHTQCVRGNACCFKLALEGGVVAVKERQLHVAAKLPQLRQQVHHQVLGTARVERSDHMQYSGLRSVL